MWRLEHRLEEWMRHLDARLDRLSESRLEDGRGPGARRAAPSKQAGASAESVPSAAAAAPSPTPSPGSRVARAAAAEESGPQAGGGAVLSDPPSPASPLSPGSRIARVKVTVNPEVVNVDNVTEAPGTGSTSTTSGPLLQSALKRSRSVFQGWSPKSDKAWLNELATSSIASDGWRSMRGMMKKTRSDATHDKNGSLFGGVKFGGRSVHEVDGGWGHENDPPPRPSQSKLYRKNKSDLEAKLTKRLSTMMDDKDGGASPVSKFVSHEYFDTFITAVVILNALLVGAQVQYIATVQHDTNAFLYAEICCTAVFTMELMLRICAQGRHFFGAKERAWNSFDASLVAISVVDIALTVSYGEDGGLPSSGAFLGKLLRILRMARIMKIIRTVRFLSQLRVMTHMIVSSMLSLFWILIILLALIYAFSIVITQGASDYLKAGADGKLPTDYDDVHTAFGSLFSTMLTLFKAMSGGRNWGEVSDLMNGPGWVYNGIIVAFIFFTLFAVVNIVTGVFVDGAIEMAKRDRQVLMQKQAKENEANSHHLLALLQAIDKDGDGQINAEEWQESLFKAEVRDFMSALQIDVNDAEHFFTILDKDGNGTVDLAEFVTGMQKLRGEAKSVDIHMLLHENRNMVRMFSECMSIMEKTLPKRPKACLL